MPVRASEIFQRTVQYWIRVFLAQRDQLLARCRLVAASPIEVARVMRSTRATDWVNGETAALLDRLVRLRSRRVRQPEEPEHIAEQRLRDDADVVGDGLGGEPVARVDGQQTFEALARLLRCPRKRSVAALV